VALLVLTALASAFITALLLPGGPAVADSSPNKVFKVYLFSASLRPPLNALTLHIGMRCDPAQKATIGGYASQTIDGQTILGTPVDSDNKTFDCGAQVSGHDLTVYSDSSTKFRNSPPDAYGNVSMSSSSGDSDHVDGPVTVGTPGS
jgi:hypothetical protein